MNLFRRFNEVGVTMLIATHDLGLVAQTRRPAVSCSKADEFVISAVHEA